MISNAPADLDPFVFMNEHPVYGDRVQTFRFPSVLSDAIRIEVAIPNGGREWSVSQVQIYQIS